MTATGEVQYIPTTTIVSSTFSGLPASNGIDGDLDTYWGAAGTSDEYFGLDLGAAAAPTAYRFTPRDDGGADGGDPTTHDFTKHQIGVVFQGSSASNFTSATTYDTIPAWPPAYPARQLNERTLSGTAAARYWRMYQASGSYTLAELRILGPQSPNVNDRPVAPTMSPWGGRYPNGLCTVTITTRTTSAAIYYTTDGTTPTPDSNHYTAPFQVTIGASGTTLKAISYDLGCSTPTCETVTTAYFKPWAYKPAEDWYDDRGVLIEAHSGGINYTNGRFYWFGQSANKDQATSGDFPNIDTVNNDGVWLYSSTDLLNWRLESHILNATSLNWRYIIRPHVRYNAATSKWVLWAQAFTGLNAPSTSQAVIATAPAITGPWAWVNENIDPDGLGFRDANLYQEGTAAYLVYENGPNTTEYVSPLASDYLTTTGSPTTPNPVGTTGREAPVIIKNGSTYFWVTSTLNYYHEDLTFDLKYGTRADLTGRFSALAALFASDPLGTIYNGQPSDIISIPGRTGFLYMSDRWSHTWLYDSRYVWLPLTFPTSTTVRALTPASWTLSTFPLSSAPVISGGAITATVGAATAAFTYTLQSGAFFAGDETVTLTATNGVLTVSAVDGVITGNGTATVTVRPACVASFTFTYTPTTPGSKTIVPTNSQGWTNPATQAVTAEYFDYAAPFTLTVTTV